MIELKLKSLEKTYSRMDLELKENFPKVFSLGELIAYNSELHRGYGVTKVHKTTEKGTRFTYMQFTNENCKNNYQDKVQKKQLNLLGNNLINEINSYKKLQVRDTYKLENEK